MIFWLGLVFGLALLVVVGIGIYGSSEITKIFFLAQPYTPKDLGWRYEAVSFPSFDGSGISIASSCSFFQQGPTISAIRAAPSTVRSPQAVPEASRVI